MQPRLIVKERDPSLYQKIWGGAEKLVAGRIGPRSVKIVKLSDYGIACDCADQTRHLNSEESFEELEKRIKSAEALHIVAEEKKYGVRFMYVEGGKEPHVVTLSSSEGDTWVCKHALCALFSLGEVSLSEKLGFKKVNNVWLKPRRELL